MHLTPPAATGQQAGVETPRQAIELARGGDVAAARALLDRIALAEPDHPDLWIAAVLVAREGGDAAYEAHALGEMLRREPRNLDALLSRAALARRQGQEQAAVRFYTSALKAAAASPPPANLHAALHEGQAFVAAAGRRFAATLDAALAEAAVDTAALPRVAGAVDLLLGREQLYVQQPSMFYFPGLAQQPFFAASAFDWAPAIEAAAPAIRAELMAALAEEDGFAPYVRSSADAPPAANHLRDDPSWGALHLFEGGAPHPRNAARFPATMAALAQAPIPDIGRRSPMALFSRLKPGTHIAPHHGVFNTRLICHLPLIVPPGCALRVGAETRAWREGELLIFDDSFEHEAWNRGDADRIVLLFEVWRPDIVPAERAAITTLLEAVERHGMLDDATD